MKVGIGYSDNPESNVAGAQAVSMAVAQAGRDDSCDMVLLFSTAQHDQAVIRQAIAAVIGGFVPVYGGGAAGVITNEYFGYAGNQVAAACIWLDDVGCEVLMEEGMAKSEREAGRRLGRRLAESGINPASPVMLLYDTFDFTDGFRMLTATGLLEGVEKGLGFFPDLIGMGMMGAHTPVPTKQWLGKGIGEHNAIALAFSGNIQMDSVIMHGCYPATGYYTVTKAVGQVILEINGKPAIQFIDELINSAVPPEQYPFFLTFGINHGERWGEYDENYYASRLCLAIDQNSGGIVMFEPDMVEGTEFQLMFRTLNPDYVKPKIEKVFNELDGREPVFAVYINCAGRCAGYAGNDAEDAPAVQEAVAGRVPVLGLYTGVEIASIGGRPRGLDWTGVFCLFSQNKHAGAAGGEKPSETPVWNADAAYSGSKQASVEAMTRLSEQNAAKVLALDASSIIIRHELEQKRRGFNLLAELSVSLRQNASNENVFIPATRRINAALNMQRTAVLLHDGKGSFSAEVLQGYTANEKMKFAGLQIKVPDELLDLDNSVIVTGADPSERFAELRELLKIPYFISSPVILQGEVYALLITGRLIETAPYFVRLSRSDMETVQAVGSLLASVLTGQRLATYEERNKIMVDAMIVGCLFWDENGNLTDCNKETLSIFGLPDKKEFIERFYALSPEYQPDGRKSEETTKEYVINTFINGESKFKWTHKMPNGELFSTEITLIRVPKGEDYTVVGYVRDLREQEAARAKMDEARKLTEKHIKMKNEFLASVSHEIRTPLNAIQAMGRIAAETKDITETQKNIILQGLSSIQVLTSAIETTLDFTKFDSDQFSLETGEFSIRGLIDRISGILRKDAEAKSLSFHASIDTKVDLVIGDFARLRQAVSNIVANAIKFTETGGVDIHVYHEEIEGGEKVLLTFEIRDTGIGIDAEQMAEIFKPLFVGDMSYTRKYGGLGMGLSVSNSLITLMGGTIKCESRPGEGSTFRIAIPLAVPEDKVALQKTSPAASGVDMLRGLNVLVAEDNNINQIIMEELLTSIGVRVTMAYNGIQAIELLKKDDFDVVLMDIQMPEMDGLTATTLIRADAKYDKLPILAMTANAGKEHYEESIKAGMNDHLAKPVDMDQLYSALLKWGKPV
ncbi:MAG: ATP-binding protein [Oscillospiraceae bacterium]|nr:ATP-binding protein [Oscillospiraceae bacterium]